MLITIAPGVRLFVDAQSARQSPVAEIVRSYPIKSDNIVAHIRKATQGRVALENTHPFQRELWGRYWVFAHNGDLKDYAPRLHASFHPVGGTDSERAFCWLMQELAKAHAAMPSVAELSVTLRELLPQIARHGTFNCMLSNGEALWAHCATRLSYIVRRHPFGRRDTDLPDEPQQLAEGGGHDHAGQDDAGLLDRGDRAERDEQRGGCRRWMTGAE